MNDKKIGNTEHSVWDSNGAVCISNNEDGYYITEFNSKAEVDIFIGELNKSTDEAFGVKDNPFAAFVV